MARETEERISGVVDRAVEQAVFGCRRDFLDVKGAADFKGFKMTAPFDDSMHNFLLR
jgi:hypothetical protein